MPNDAGVTSNRFPASSENLPGSTPLMSTESRPKHDHTLSNMQSKFGNTKDRHQRLVQEESEQRRSETNREDQLEKELQEARQNFMALQDHLIKTSQTYNKFNTVKGWCSRLLDRDWEMQAMANVVDDMGEQLEELWEMMQV